MGKETTSGLLKIFSYTKFIAAGILVILGLIVASNVFPALTNYLISSIEKKNIINLSKESAAFAYGLVLFLNAIIVLIVGILIRKVSYDRNKISITLMVTVFCLICSIITSITSFRIEVLIGTIIDLIIVYLVYRLYKIG